MAARRPISKLAKLIVTPVLGLAMVCGLLVLYGGLSPPAIAAPLSTPIVGSITTPFTFTQAGSPYTLTGIVSVINGAKLTIEPGVEVRFLAGAELQLSDQAQLAAIGTPGQPITFTSDLPAPAAGDWNGIRFDSDAMTGTIHYALIEYAQVGVEFKDNLFGTGYDVSNSTFRYIDSGAIMGSPDDAQFNYNTIYRAGAGIKVNEAFGNSIQGNQIYDVDESCIALNRTGPSSTAGSDNQIIDNQLHHCQERGIWLQGSLTGSGDSANQVIGNQIWRTGQQGLYAYNQNNFTFQSNVVYSTALTSTLGAVILERVDRATLQDNYLYDNGTPGLYEGALHVLDTGIGPPIQTFAINITDTRLKDRYGSGLVFHGANYFDSQVIHSNAICVDDRYEVKNRSTNALTVTATGNWLGTNFPIVGTEITGTVTFSPYIQLTAAAFPSILPADGLSTAVVTVTMNDGAGHTVPVGARQVNLTTNLGTLADTSLTLDNNGLATTTLTSNVSGLATITVTEWCGFPVTTTVQFQAADVGVEKTTILAQVIPGETITYTVAYSNSSGLATNVRLTDTLPTGTSWLTDTAESLGFTRLQTTPEVVWDLGDLTAGASGVITVVARLSAAATASCGQMLTNSVAITTATLDNNPGNNTGSDSSISVICADVGISKSSPLTYVIPGELITYTIPFSNDGDTPATGMIITDTLPTGTSWLTDTAESLGFTRVQTSPEVIWTLPWLGAHLSDTITLVAWVQPTVGCSQFLTNTVLITSTTPDAVTTNERYSHTLPTACADVAINKVGPGGNIVPGQTITYTIYYSNTGTAPADNVVITDVNPITGGIDTLLNGGITLPPTGNGSLNYVVTADASMCSLSALTNTAYISTSTPEITTTNNVATSTNSPQVHCVADLAISKDDGRTTVRPGDLLTYTLTISNYGNVTATGIVVTDTIPTYTTFIAASHGGSHAGGVVTWPPFDLPVPPTGNSLTRTVTVQVNNPFPAGVNLITNTATVTHSADVITTTNNTDTDIDIVESQPDLIITKTLVSLAPSLGKVTTFTIEYRNIGPYTATGVVITDFLDNDVNYITDTLGGAVTTTNTVVWSVSDLAPGAGNSFDLGVNLDPNFCVGTTSFTNSVRIAAIEPDLNAVDNFYEVGPIPIDCNVDLVVIKNDGIGTGDPRTEARAGEYITYTISVNNVGAQIAGTVILTETLPANTSFVGPSGPDGWFQVGTSNLYTYHVGTLWGGEGRVVNFVVQVDPALPCSITETVNTVEADSNAVEGDPADNISREQTPVVCDPTRNLQVHKDDGLICAVPNQTITYTITYSNTGSSSVNDVFLTDIKPDYTNFLPGGVNTGWADLGGGAYSRTLGTVAPGGPFGPVYFQVQLVGPSAIPTDVTAITNVIQISGGHTFTEVTSVPIVPDLTVAKNDNIGVTSPSSEFTRLYQQVAGTAPPISAQADNVGPNDIIAYSIVYVNNGRAPTTGVVLTETLPLYTTYAGGPEWTNVSGRLYTYNVGNLDPNQGGFLTFRVQVTNTLPLTLEWIINRVEIGGYESHLECYPGNNISYEQTPVNPSAPVSGFVYLPIILKGYSVTPPPTPVPTPTPTPLPLAHVSDVAADPDTNQIFVASPRQDAVHVIDGVGDTYKSSVPVGHGPTGLAVLSSTTPSKVFAAHAFAANNWTPGIWIIDVDSLNSRAMMHEQGYVGVSPVKLAANPNTGRERVYVSNYHDRLPIIYGPTEARLGWVPKKSFQASYGIDVSRRTDLVYLATIDTGELVIFDSYQAEGVPNYGACHHAPEEPRILRTVAVNQATGHVFVGSPPDANKGQTSSKVLVLDEDKLLEETGGPPSDGTCTWNFAVRPEDIGISAIPGPAWVADIELPGAVSAGEEGLAVNASTNRVYVTDGPGDQLFVIDYDPTTNTANSITAVPVDDNPQGVAVNELTNKIYVGNAHHPGAPYGTVTVVNGTNNTVIKTIPLVP